MVRRRKRGRPKGDGRTIREDMGATGVTEEALDRTK